MKQLFAGALSVLVGGSLFAQSPEWIWFRKTDAADTCFFRKTFTLDTAATAGELVATGDDSVRVYLNGERVITANDWSQGHRAEVKAKLRVGRNTIAIRSENADGSPAGALASLVVTTAAGQQTVVTDATWKAEDRELPGWNQVTLDNAAWGTATSLGKVGIGP